MCCILLGGIIAGIQWKKARTESIRANEALQALKGTTPALMIQAESYKRDGDLSQALETMNYALYIDKNNSDYLLKKAHLLQAMMNMNEAISTYQEVLALDSENTEAKQNLQLCNDLIKGLNTSDKLPPQAISGLYLALRDQGRYQDSIIVIENFLL